MFALELSLAQADSLLAYNQKGLELGILTESDVLEAKSARLAREQEILNQKNTIRDAEDVLKKLLNITTDGGWTVEILPTEKLTVEPVEPDADRAFEEA
jgi:outer membrane protein TolC